MIFCFDFLANQIDSIFPTVCSVLDPKSCYKLCGNYFHYEITKETKSCQLLRQCPSLVPSPRYFGRRFLFRFTWSSRGSLSLWLQRLGDMDVRRKTTAQAFAILTAIDLKQTNEQQIARCYDKKQNKTEEQQQKWITAAWLFVYRMVFNATSLNC